MSASPKVPAVEVAVRTDPGRDPDKAVNEDSSVCKETPHGLLAVVCDGMGGHAGGKEASELATKTILEIVEAAPPATTPGVALKRAIEEANGRVWSMPTAEAGFRPGSTVVGILAHDGGIEVAHVGDSRLYCVHAGAISQVTRDHSMVQEMVDRNLIRAEDAAKHPDANKILRALGIAKEVDVELRPEPVAFVNGDIFVLCSDGLSDLVEPRDILEIAGSHPPAQAAGQLVDLANARGGHDNITALVVRMKSTSTPREGAGVVKTVALTAHAAPVDPTFGGTGTLLSAPLAPTQPTHPAYAPTQQSPQHGGHAGHPSPMHTQVAAPLPHAHAPVPPHGMSAPAMPPYAQAGPPPSSGYGRSRVPALVVGVVLALIGLGIVGAVVGVLLRKPHRTIGVVEDHRDGSAAAVVSGDAGTEIAIAPAPTLAPTLPPPDASSATKWVRPPDAGTDPCAWARRARVIDAGQARIDAADAKCRQAGGSP